MSMRGIGKSSNAVCLLLVVLLVICGGGGGGGVMGDKGESITEECSKQFEKVMTCLSFATGKEAVPSKSCCESIGDIKDHDPKCLCFILQQAHNGSDKIRSLGIQEQKLLQLPSACKLQNASLADCPTVLGLAPNSPDAAIFTNASTTAAPLTGKTTPATGSTKNPSSTATKNGPYLAATASLMIVAAIFLHTSSVGSAFYI